MPFRKRYQKKRRNVRAHKMIKNQWPQTYKLKATGTLTTDGAGALTFNTQAGGVTTIGGDYTNLSSLYDSFIVKGMSVRIFPVNVGAENPGAAIIRGNLGSVIDMDGTGLPATIAAQIEYNSFKMHSSRSPAKRYIGIPPAYRPDINDLGIGFSAGNKNTAIQYRLEGFGAAQLAYYYLITWYVTCIGRR